MAPLTSALVISFVITTVILVGLALWATGQPRGGRRRPKGRMVECAVCGRQIPAAKAVIVHGQITRDRDAYATTVAEYCKAHAPGPPRSLP